MSSLRFSRNVPNLCAAAVVLAGCSGSQPPIGAPGAMPQSQTSAIATRAKRGGSWMLPEAKSSNLLYVADSASGVYVFTYPKGRQVGLLGVNATGGLCSDKAGDVFVTDFIDEQVVEYPHGGKRAIAKLYPDAQPRDCSVDPVTGNLATVNLDVDNTTSVSVFKSASGGPTKYTEPNAGLGPTCSYDGAGNLYLAAGTKSQPFLIAELPYGGGNFTNITVKGSFRGGNFLEWDGTYVAVTNAYPKRPVIVSRIEVSGSTGSVVGTTKLRDSYGYLKYFWIGNGTLFTPFSGGGPKARRIGAWHYPGGGNPVATITVPKGKYEPGIALDLTLSVAPKDQPRTRPIAQESERRQHERPG